MFSNLVSDAWAEYLAGVMVLATGTAASALVRAWRRRRTAQQDPDASGSSE